MFARLCVIGGNIGRVGGTGGTGYHIGGAVVGVFPLVGVGGSAVGCCRLGDLGQCGGAAVADGRAIGGDGTRVEPAEFMLDAAGVA